MIHLEPRDFVDIEVKIIEEMFLRQKEIYPQVILVKDAERFCIPVHLTSNVQRDVVSQGIKDLVKRSEPDVVIYMSEAWAVTIKAPADRLSFLPPLKYQEKTEMLNVQIEFATGEKFSCTSHILRSGDEVRLSPFSIVADGWVLGRFMDFFPVKAN